MIQPKLVCVERCLSPNPYPRGEGLINEFISGFKDPLLGIFPL